MGWAALAGRSTVHVKRHTDLRALGVFGEPWAGVTAGAQPAQNVMEQGQEAWPGREARGSRMVKHSLTRSRHTVALSGGSSLRRAV